MVHDTPNLLSFDGPRRYVGPAIAKPWPMRMVVALAGGTGTVILLGLVGHFLRYKLGITHSFGFVNQFDPDAEGNFSTWYSSTQLLLGATLLGMIAVRSAGRAYCRHWWGLAILFVGMSADETAQIHEMFVAPLRNALHLSGVFYFAWVIPGALFGLGVFIAYLGFLRHLPARTRIGLIVAGAVYLGGALGMEMAGALEASHSGTQTIRYALLASAEEGLEMCGAVLLAYVAGDYLRRMSSTDVREHV